MNKVFSILLPLFLLSCVNPSGTNTGNPEFRAPNAGVIETPALRLGSAVCSKIYACYPSSNKTQCLSSAFTLASFPQALGLVAAQYSSLITLSEAEMDLIVTSNSEAHANCLSAILNLDCSSQIILDGYSASTPSDFSNAYSLFQSSDYCQSIYSN